MFAKLLAFLMLCWSLFVSRLPGILLVCVAFVVLSLIAVGFFALTEAWERAHSIKTGEVSDATYEEVEEDA
jgi:hypothetical protein